jgi:hypothetical protein
VKHEGDLMRMDQQWRTDVWQPARDGESARWIRYQLDIFGDSYSFISPALARQPEPDADLYPPPTAIPPGTPTPGSGRHVRARDATAG